MFGRDSFLFSKSVTQDQSTYPLISQSYTIASVEEETRSWAERFRDWIESRNNQQEESETSTPGDESSENNNTPTQPTELLSEYTSSAKGSGFNIHIQFAGDQWTPELQKAFINASNYLSSVITGDLRDINSYGFNVDDISITAELTPIDGPGRALGQAGPTYTRSDNNLPFTASMQFDIADADSMLQSGGWAETVLHEMTHSLGFGTVWTYMGLTSGTNFIGENATAVYEELFDIENMAGVPTDTYGGHFSEAVLGSDLMSPYLSYGSEPELSDLALAALEDMGYDTVFDLDTFLAA